MYILRSNHCTHIETNDLKEENQSVYRKFHNTETALLKVRSDVLRAVDNQEITCLVLLDLSAEFDTVDHQVLLNCLEKQSECMKFH